VFCFLVGKHFLILREHQFFGKKFSARAPYVIERVFDFPGSVLKREERLRQKKNTGENTAAFRMNGSNFVQNDIYLRMSAPEFSKHVTKTLEQFPVKLLPSEQRNTWTRLEFNRYPIVVLTYAVHGNRAQRTFCH